MPTGPFKSKRREFSTRIIEEEDLFIPEEEEMVLVGELCVLDDGILCIEGSVAVIGG